MKLKTFAPVAAVLLGFSISAQSQSLVDVAKKEKARRAENAKAGRAPVAEVDFYGLRTVRTVDVDYVPVEVVGGGTYAPMPTASPTAPPVVRQNPGGVKTPPTQPTTSAEAGAGNTDLSKGWSTKGFNPPGGRGWNTKRDTSWTAGGRERGVQPIHPTSPPRR